MKSKIKSVATKNSKTPKRPIALVTEEMLKKIFREIKLDICYHDCDILDSKKTLGEAFLASIYSSYIPKVGEVVQIFSIDYAEYTVEKVRYEVADWGEDENGELDSHELVRVFVRKLVNQKKI